MTLWHCAMCAHRIDAEEAPEECAKCGSTFSYSQVGTWRFF